MRVLADDKVAEAVDVVARDVIWTTLYSSLDHNDTWGEYPEIGEHDWEAVEKRLWQIIDNLKPERGLFDAAYEFLEGRANR
jgi:hypothetical protein